MEIQLAIAANQQSGISAYQSDFSGESNGNAPASGRPMDRALADPILVSCERKYAIQVRYMESRTCKIGISNRMAPALTRFYERHGLLSSGPQEPAQPVPDQERLRAALEDFWEASHAMLRGKGSGDAVPGRSAEARKSFERAKVLFTRLASAPEGTDITVDSPEECKALRLPHSCLLELSDGIGRLASASVLDVTGNFLRRVPSSIGQLAGLKELVLCGNKLQSLPVEIGLCRELRLLDASANELTELPRSLIALRKLSTLRLSSNRLTALPAFIGKLSALHYLSISDNPISSLPFELFGLPRLWTLIAIGCPFAISQSCEEIGSLSCREVLARRIVRRSLRVPRGLSPELRRYLMAAEECASCGGALFEYRVELRGAHTFRSVQYPVHYKMCQLHYSRHEHRPAAQYKLSSGSSGQGLSVTELFEPYCFSQEQRNELNSSAETVPLYSLAIAAE
ncbi:leucine-rich repeat protein SHOC2 [Pancytospora philotis]|nr:leucine-rich repeat protein SHOC2 [Pancytospora philotis]